MEDGILGTLGKYETRGILGRGAMGTVYEGWDPIIARRVAIKTVVLPDLSDREGQDELARFKREAQAAGRLNHPNIVGVFDYGETATHAYIVMEFVAGTTLKSLLDQGDRMNLADIVRVMQQLLAGLQYSHERGVVHRDIKPANIIVTVVDPQGDEETPHHIKIADFGIARIESSAMTQAGTIMGTPAYMSPEQFSGQTVDARTDIYSCGILLYQLLTGERPFEGGFSAIMHKALHTVPPPPSVLSVTTPRSFDAVVARAMAKRPDERFATAAAFSAAIRAAFEAPPALVEPAQNEEATVFAPSGAGSRTTKRVTSAVPSMAADEPAARARLPLFAAVGVAAIIALAGGTWFVLRPVAGNAPEAVKALPSAYSPFAGGPAAGTPETSAKLGPTGEPAKPVIAVPHNEAAATKPPVEPAILTPKEPAPKEPAQSEPVQGPQLALKTEPNALPPAPAKPAASLTEIASALAKIPCSLISAAFVAPNNMLSLSGVVGKGSAETQAHTAIGALVSTGPVEWQVVGFDGPYCRVLDLLRGQGLTPDAAAFNVTLARGHGRAQLKDGDLITLKLSMPDFPAQLAADYFQHDGSVFHMYPTASDPPRLYPPNSQQTLGDPSTGGASWEVGEPYGTDLIVAIASTGPLVSVRKTPSEPEDHYLSDLQNALEAAKKHGMRLAVSAFILETSGKSP